LPLKHLLRAALAGASPLLGFGGRFAPPFGAAAGAFAAACDRPIAPLNLLTAFVEMGYTYLQQMRVQAPPPGGALYSDCYRLCHA